MLKPLMRLQVSLMSHAPLLVLAVVVMCLVARLSLINPIMLGELALLVSVLIVLVSVSQRLSNRPLIVVLLLVIGVAILFPTTAHASIGTMMQSIKNDMTYWIEVVIYGCYGGGIFSTAMGVSNGIKKSKGDQQVTTGSIFGYGLGGPALGMVGYLMNNAAESLGGSAGQMGRLPGGLF